MDKELLTDLQGQLVQLLLNKRPLNGHPFAQEEFMSGFLSYITEEANIPTERFHWLKNITGAKCPMILAHKTNNFWRCAEKLPDENFNFVRKPKQSAVTSASSSVNESTTEGSPLKLNIIADLSDIEGDESVFTPVMKQTDIDCGLPLVAVRTIISMYSNLLCSVQCDAFQTITPPNLIALSDGENFKSVSCLGLTPVINTDNRLSGVKISECLSKPCSDRSVHAKMVPKFGSASVQCSAKFDILGDVSVSQTPDWQCSLELSWRKLGGRSVVLLHDPPIEAKSKVKIQVTSGCPRSPAFSVYQELEILRAIIQSLRTTEVNWVGTQDRPMVESVQDLIEQLKLGSDLVEYHLGETLSEGEFMAGFDSVLLEERKDLDFTDHLWKILQNCTSYNELVDSFNHVVTVIRSGQLQPFIHSYNTTTIGMMVKDSCRGQMRAPSMVGLSPLQYLAEMGLQKLTHDYIYMFLSKNLTSLSQLDFYLKGNLEMEDKLERLTRLQNILEVIIMLKQCLNLSYDTLKECMRKMLKHYEGDSVNDGYKFSFGVPTVSLMNVVEACPPTDWRAVSETQLGDATERLAYVCTSEQPFDWIKLDPDVGLSQKRGSGDIEEASYYLTIVKESVSMLK